MPKPRARFQSFLATFDSHWGYEREAGRLHALHDVAAHEVVLQFARAFKPDVYINGGDGLDCGAISHWRRDRHRSVEGLRLIKDAVEYGERFLNPLADIVGTCHYLPGNHERWIDDLVDREPALEDTLRLDLLLQLGPPWTLHPYNAVLKLGKLYFTHGDQVRGGQHAAKWAVETYGRSIRLGHFHTWQAFTRHNAIDAHDIHTGVVVPSLCKRDPGYIRRAPNRWSHGFLYGYINADGSFWDAVVPIIKGRAVVEGRLYSAKGH